MGKRSKLEGNAQDYQTTEGQTSRGKPHRVNMGARFEHLESDVQEKNSGKQKKSSGRPPQELTDKNVQEKILESSVTTAEGSREATPTVH